MRHTAYSAYKDSGIEWLGKIPEHWTLRRLKYLADVQLSNVDKHTVEGEQSVSLCNYVDVYRNDFITSEIPFMRATASNEQIKRLALQKDDAIITKDSESPDDIGIPALVTEGLDGVVCGYHLALVRPRKGQSSGAFLSRSFQGRFVRSVFETEATGMTRYALGKYSIENLELPVPPLQEQQSIATFLDRETDKIDQLVTEQRELIKLLREKRQAVISHAVTKGLDPNIPMIDSEVEWLAEIPEHWEIKPIKAVASCNDDVLHEATPKDYEIQYVEISSINSSEGIVSTEIIPFGEAPSRARRRVQHGDVIVSTVRTVCVQGV